MWFFIVTMFFGGGLIPYYYLISGLGLINTMGFNYSSRLSVWNMFMVKAFYESTVSQELIEAAAVDGQII